MTTRKSNRLIQFVPPDSPKHILMNYGSLTLYLGSIGTGLLALFIAYSLGGVFPFVCLGAGVWFSTFWVFFRPPNLFFSAELWMKRRMKLSELDDSALRVLTFFKSRQARHLAMSVATAWTLAVGLGWYLSFFVLPKPRPPVGGATLEHILTGSLGFGFVFTVATLGNYMVLLCRYTLNHWDEIQAKYKPWPTTEPFELPLKDIWKARSWKRPYE